MNKTIEATLEELSNAFRKLVKEAYQLGAKDGRESVATGLTIADKPAESPQFKTVKRHAEVGERILIVDASEQKLKEPYENGYVMTVTEEVMFAGDVKCGVYGYIDDYEYEVIIEEDETIEHEGLVLRKVDRKRRKGDYVRFQNLKGTSHTKNNVFYEVLNEVSYLDDRKEAMRVDFWIGDYTSELFEVVGYVDLPCYPQDEPVPLKTPNEQRKKTIQQAREVIENSKKLREGELVYIIKGFPGYWCDAEFIVNAEKRTVVCLLKYVKNKRIVAKGIAKCMPGDVFNEWIGKAIALARALEIEIPKEFLDAVQPDEVVVGHYVINKYQPRLKGHVTKMRPENDDAIDGIAFGHTHDDGYMLSNRVTITDDTNAEYGHGE